jgi:hypothetical protein
MTQAHQGEIVFNLIAEGTGYLRRIRVVTKDSRGKTVRPYLACTINAMMGRASHDPAQRSLEYLSYDCIVVGQVARRVIESLRKDVDAKRRVLVGFRAGDARPDPYVVTNKETGEQEQRIAMKGRLLQITFAKVDGQKVEIELVPRQSNTRVDDEGIGSACEDNSRMLAMA